MNTMPDIPAGVEIKHSWYNHPSFPLIPTLWTRAADKWNAADFSISWLGVTLHSMMSPELGFGIELSDRGLYFYIALPYLRFRCWLMMFPFSWHQKAWRKGKNQI